ncbi:hypothetical protein Dsin_018997 [Dipteronia sinensis]|uniref:MULE transposase domain-containing protein n=1 Tax=Dipteronia sinensis TaxID=43782 RepID=A0AAE0A6I8_9ROSI|nr:hypothetical protein Dsin_018997 [Dipteronia sinensis]
MEHGSPPGGSLEECSYRNMGVKKLVIHHGGSWAANCYEGGMTKWVHVPIGLTYDDFVKLVQDAAKVDAHRSTLELCSLAFTTTGTARPRIENDKDVSCMMDEDKLLPEVYVTVSKKVATHCVQNGTILEEDDNLIHSTFLQQCNLPTPQPVYGGFLRQLAACGYIPMLDPIVCNDETIDDEENSESSDTDNRDDSSIPDIDRGPSGFATFSGDSFREDGLGDGVDQSCEHASSQTWIIPGSERYSFEPISTEESISDNGRLYKGLYLQYRWFPRKSSTSKFLDCRRTISTKVASTRPLSTTQRHNGRNASGSWTSFVVYKGLEGKRSCRGFCFGPPEESFKLLPAYCHRLKEVNPGTITAMKTNVANQFEYLFIAHAASLHGFHTVIRPVIAIDGTHLKGKFSGIMFVAICLDANNQVFPLAYGFGDVENEMSWTWFLKPPPRNQGCNEERVP